MVCRDILDRLSPFLDDELGPVESREVVRHLDSCQDCAKALAGQRELSENLRRDLEYHRAPDILRARISRDVRAAVRRDTGAGLRVAARPWGWLSMAATLIVLVGGAWFVGSLPREQSSDVIIRDAVSGHIRSMMATHLTDVASTDQHTVKPWFSGKLDFSPPVVDLAGAGYPLVGGRLDYLNGRAVAALVYKHREHVINVFVWPVEDAHDVIAPAVTHQGFHVIRGARSRMEYLVVSDLNSAELTTFARMLVAPPEGP